MKHFALIYDLGDQKLVESPPKEFDESQMPEALAYVDDAYQRAESSGADREIVLISAPSLDVVKQTHGSYFFSASELLDQMRETVRNRPRHRNGAVADLLKVSETSGEYEPAESS